MKKLFLVLSVFAIAVTLTLGLGAFNDVKALTGFSGERANGLSNQANLAGIDEALVTARTPARDLDPDNINIDFGAGDRFSPYPPYHHNDR